MFQGQDLIDNAKRTMDTVNQGDFPAAMEHVSKLMSASQSPNTSAKDVSRIILKDLGLTNKVLKITNSAYYSIRSGSSRKISTVTGAVVLLGFKVVCDIAAGVCLFDYLSTKTNNIKGLKRMVALSFTSASFARELSRAINYPDEEEAYLCGLFYDLGRLVAAFMLSEEYGRLQKEVEKGSPEAQAAKAHLGMTVRELGMSVAKVWNFPEKIQKSMEAMPEKTDGKPSETDILRALASMGHLVSRAALSGPEADKELSRIISLYGKFLPINEDIIGEVKDEAERRAAELMAPLGIDISVLKDGAEADRPKPADAEAQDQEMDDSERRKECILNASVEITESIIKGCDLDSTFMIIIESMQNGLGLEHAFLSIVDPGRTIIKARYGVGALIDESISKLVLPLKDSSGIIASCVAWGKDMTVSADSSVLPQGDEMVLKVLDASSIAAFPIIVDNRSIGCFVVSKKGKAMDAATIRQAGKLRDYAVLAIESSRSRRPKK